MNRLSHPRASAIPEMAFPKRGHYTTDFAVKRPAQKRVRLCYRIVRFSAFQCVSVTVECVLVRFGAFQCVSEPEECVFLT